MNDGFKLLGAHRECCHAKDDLDGLTFLVPDGTEYRDKIGRRSRKRALGHAWYRFRCNGTQCPAVALVRWDRLGYFVTRGIRGSA